MLGADPVDGVSPNGAPSLVCMISGIVSVVGAPVDVVVPTASTVVLVIGFEVYGPGILESVLSDEEVESEEGVTGSEINTSQSVVV